MSNAIDMTLDDLIKKNKQSKSSRGRGGARPSSSSVPGGPPRRNFKRRGNRSAPYSTAKVQALRGSWPASASIETGTKLYISNLHYGVSTEDLKELFSIVGELKKCNVHYDRSARSKETADVVFARRVYALAAIKKYNNVQLDGKPMKIEIVGKNISSLATASASASVNKNSTSGGRRGKEEDNHVALVVVDLGEAVGEEEGIVVRRFLPRILTLNWTSTIQNQCRPIEGSSTAARHLS